MKNLSIKSKITLISIFAFLTILSCAPAKKDTNQTPQIPIPQQNQVQENTIDPQIPEPATPKPSNVPAPEEKSTQVAINPPHGQPGHSCAIPVGAPLNSAPVNTPRQTISNSPTVKAPTITNNPTASSIANNPMAPTIENAKRLNSSQSRSTASVQNSGRINPPHGQPGHSCAIPVGSPLP